MLIDRSILLTERRLEDSMRLDAMSIEHAIHLINAQDALAVRAVADQRSQIARAVAMVAECLAARGRLIYIGAGTSGRLGVLDASECPPTFGSDPSSVQGIIAGGDAAMFRAQEGAEDRPDDGAAAIDAREVGADDVVMGIAAGGTTPFVAGALERATARGARTIFLTCVQPNASEPRAELVIRPLVGPEVLTGSTRLKAGTATKLVLNTITTLAMVRLGKVHENLMVDLRITNAKLRDRAIRIISTLCSTDPARSLQLLEQAGNHVKTAIVMGVRSLPADAAGALLDRHGGNLRAALDSTRADG